MKRGLSAYLPVRNGELLDYPWRSVAESLLGVADELIYCDSDSTDETRAIMLAHAARDKRVRVINWPWPVVPTPDSVAAKQAGPPGKPRLLIEWLNYCRGFCQFDMQITSDADEILCPKSYPRIREAVYNRECLYFFRLHFWRDHRHITQNDKVCGSYVARCGPTELEMVSDEMRPEGEPPIRERAIKHPSLRFFHAGFIRRPQAFYAKSKVVQAALHNTYDPRLTEAEATGKNWCDLTEVGQLIPYTADDWPEVAWPWLREHGYEIRGAPKPTHDRFEGTALLCPFEGTEYLHVLAVRGNNDRKPWRMCIPVRPTGTAKTDRLTWEYAINGDMIHVHPSVKVTDHEDRETFHSPGQWAVKFERFTPSTELIWNDGIGDHGQRKRFVELNPGDFSV